MRNLVIVTQHSHGKASPKPKFSRGCVRPAKKSPVTRSVHSPELPPQTRITTSSSARYMRHLDSYLIPTFLEASTAFKKENDTATLNGESVPSQS